MKKLNNDSVLLTSVDQAALASDIIIIAVPGMRSLESAKAFAATLGDGAAGKVSRMHIYTSLVYTSRHVISSASYDAYQVVIDATNPLSEFPALEVMWGSESSGGELLQQALPSSLLFKVKLNLSYFCHVE